MLGGHNETETWKKPSRTCRCWQKLCEQLWVHGLWHLARRSHAMSRAMPKPASFSGRQVLFCAGQQHANTSAPLSNSALLPALVPSPASLGARCSAAVCAVDSRWRKTRSKTSAESPEPCRSCDRQSCLVTVEEDAAPRAPPLRSPAPLLSAVAAAVTRAPVTRDGSAGPAEVGSRAGR